MHNNDRGMIKWSPFNSVISGKVMINDVLNKKKKVKKPLLSDEQIIDLEKKIINAYYENSIIYLKYFFNGEIKDILGNIKKIDFTYKKIYFNDKCIYFNQITEILY